MVLKPQPHGGAIKTPIQTREEGQALRQHREVKKEIARESLRKPGSRIGKEEWDRIFTSKVFADQEWRDLYNQTKRDMRHQYDVHGRNNAQYRILVDECAAVSTLVSMMEAMKSDPILIVHYRDQLIRLVAQLQKYTEAEKREVTVRNEALEAALMLAVGIAEVTIGDAATRRNFLIALTRRLGEAGHVEISEDEFPALPEGNIIEGQAVPA